MPNVKNLSAVALLLFISFVHTEVTAAVLPRAAGLDADHSVTYDSNNNTYTFQATGIHTATYVVDLDHPDIQQGMLHVRASVDRGPFYEILTQAGTRYTDATGQVLEPAEYAQAGALHEHRLDGDELVLSFIEQPGANQLQKTYRLSLQGLSLKIHFQSGSTRYLDGYAGINLGHAQIQGQDKRVIQVPYLPMGIGLLPADTVMSAYVDPSTSSATSISSADGIGENGTLYCHSRTLSLPDLSGTKPAMDETAYLTISNDLSDLYAAPDTPPSAYRSELSDKLVLDVWGMHRSFSAKEGVQLAWRTDQQKDIHAWVEYADIDGACGNGVELSIKTSQEPLTVIRIHNGDTQAQTWESDAHLESGDEIMFSIDRAGDNSCDGTLLHVRITSADDNFDSIDDFSSTQGFHGFYYLEYLDDERTPMTFDQEQGFWVGKGNFSILGAGFAHPGTGNSSFLDAENMVERYVEYGLVNLAIIFHVWQRWGYDQGLPDHYPANPDLGTSEQMASFVSAAKQAGMLVALHENYTDMYPDNPPDYPSPLWDPSAIALDANGDRKLGWYHPFTHQQAYVIAADRMLEFSQLESRAIASDYAPDAAYLDVTTGWTPRRAIDHTHAAGKAPTMAWSYYHTTNLFDFIKSVYAGPLLGEGGEGPDRFDSFFAGHVDAVERQVEGRRWAQVIPDYELTCIKPLMLNHGMGYYSRYFTPYGQQPIQASDLDLDQYRASELAFGHAGFLGEGVGGVNDWLALHAPEYWLVQAVQTEIADAPFSGTLYFDGQEFIQLGQALRDRMDLSRAKLKISYTNGASLWINRDSSSGEANSLGGFSSEQGFGGWTYLEDQGLGPVELQWDPEQKRWQGARRWSIIASNYLHPDGIAIIRAFRAPVDTTMDITATVSDGDLSCGDGVLAHLELNGTDLWTCDLAGDVQNPCEPTHIQVSVLAGDEISLRVEPKANNNCDTTFYEMNMEWQDNTPHDWTIYTPDGTTMVLPPSGFYYYSPESQTQAATFRASSGQVVDFVDSSSYSYRRSRTGTLTTAREFSTDGAVAVVYSIHGDDLHGQGFTTAQKNNEPIITLTKRADFNLWFIDPVRALVVVRNMDDSVFLDATWYDLPQAWLDELSLHPENLSICPSNNSGDVLGQCDTVPVYESGAVSLLNLAQGQTYLLKLATGCTGADCCGDGSCDSGDENCSTCPKDCPVPDGSMCCDGIVIQGDCCIDSDCQDAQICHNNQCVTDSDGGDGGMDGQGHDGAVTDGSVNDNDHNDAGLATDSHTFTQESGCGCSSAQSTFPTWIVILLLFVVVSRSTHRNRP